MRKRILSLLLALVLVLGLVPVGASADEVVEYPPVNVYLSLSDDAEFMVGEDSGKPIAMLPVSVPYFDLANYGLEEFYFVSESYGTDDPNAGPGSDLENATQEPKGIITALHMLIYVTEVYYVGIDPEEAGQGQLYTMGLIGSADNFNPDEDTDKLIFITGGVGSSFMNWFWEGDCNFNYYVNYQYPEAKPGWGATSDQIVLREGDIVTLGSFSNWDFYSDPFSIFNYIKADKTSVTAGEEVHLTHWRAGADLGSSVGTGTAQTQVELSPDEYEVGAEIYMCDINDMNGGDVTQWKYSLGNFALDGTYTLDTTGLEPGTYMIAIPGQPGYMYSESITSTPGGMLLTVTAPSAPQVVLGDVNGDTEVTAMDVSLTAQKAAGKEVTITTAAADVNGDNAITAMDVSLIAQFAAGKITQFSAEANNQ